CYRSRDGLLMRFAIGAGLVIAPDGENRKIDAESDKNGAKTHADHAQSSEKKLAHGKRYETGQKKTKRHAQQRKPSAKPDEKNRAHEYDGAKQRRDDIVTHAQ